MGAASAKAEIEPHDRNESDPFILRLQSLPFHLLLRPRIGRRRDAGGRPRLLLRSGVCVRRKLRMSPQLRLCVTIVEVP